MSVGVIDVGSQSVRLLIAAPHGDAVSAVREERELVGLGDDVERYGRISGEKLERTAKRVRAYARIARAAGVRALDVIVTAPGRQSENGDELVAAIAEATGARVRVLSADDEARLAFAGAVAGARTVSGTVAVCDLGGGSTEIAVGTPVDGPVWVRSVDIGALRLTLRRIHSDPPTKFELEAARDDVALAFGDVLPPLPQAALATGGTARSLRKIVGRTLGPEELESALRILRKRPSKAIAKTFGIPVTRARTLGAGCVVLLELQSRLAVPFEVVSSGIREGAALSLLAEAAAA